MISQRLDLLGSLLHGVGGSSYVWEAIFLLRAIIAGVPLRPGLNIPLYWFAAAIFIPIFCLYIHRDDILLGVWGRGRVGLNCLIPFSVVIWRIGFTSSLGSLLSCHFLKEWLLHLFY